ncbi:MAG: hypothetical protein Q8P20_01035 [bacterium]|nr:hypothetical protein [bacterium]
MTKLKLVLIFIFFLLSWLMYYKIEKSRSNPNNLQWGDITSNPSGIGSTNLILEPPKYYKATIIKPGKEYKLLHELD